MIELRNLSGFRPISGLQLSAAAVGLYDLHPVATGKRVLVQSFSGVAVGAASGASVATLKAKLGGVSYGICPAVSNSTLSTPQPIFIYEAGDVVQCNVLTANSNVFFRAVEFNDTAELFTARTILSNNGDNTLYTADGDVMTLDWTMGYFPNASSGQGTVCIHNDSGGSRNYQVNSVPSGGSPGSGNQVALTPVTAGNNVTLSGNLKLTTALGAGDSIVVNTSDNTGPQLAWVNLLKA